MKFPRWYRESRYLELLRETQQLRARVKSLLEQRQELCPHPFEKVDYRTGFLPGTSGEYCNDCGKQLSGVTAGKKGGLVR